MATPVVVATPEPVLPPPAGELATGLDLLAGEAAVLNMAPGSVTVGNLKLDVGALPFEKAMLAIMRAEAPDAAKAQALLGLLSQVPEEGLATTAEQAAKWLPDRSYRLIAGPVITNPKTHAQVLTALFADLMQRPDAVALPTLVDIAKTPDHPLAPSAHDNLNLLVGKDYGVNWPAWDQAVLARLSLPPDTAVTPQAQ